MNKNLLNMLGFKKDPREEAYQQWLQLQGGGGVPNISDYETITPGDDVDPEQVTMNQAGYDQSMQNYDLQRKLEEMETNKFYAKLASLFAPQPVSQPRAGAWGPSSRPFADYMPMRYWS